MKKLTVLAIATIASLALFYACSKSDNQQSNTLPVSSKPQYIFGLVEEAVSPADLTQLKVSLEDKPIYSRVRKDVDFNNVKSYIKDNKRVFVFRFKDANKVYAVGAENSKALIITDEALAVKKMTDASNGMVGILKNMQSIVVDIKNGRDVVREATEPEFRAQFMFQKDEQFCQRQRNESFADCYRREKDEFCDSFISCIAGDIFWQISVVIAIACECEAENPR